MGVLPDEKDQSKVACHGGEVDDQEHQEQGDLQPWEICESCENKLHHQSLVCLHHIHSGYHCNGELKGKTLIKVHENLQWIAISYFYISDALY